MTTIDIRPLTLELWPAFEKVMGPNGAYAGCWCSYWRVSWSEYKARSGDGHKARYKKIVKAGPPPGLLAFIDEEPAGWVQICPRADLPTLDRSDTLARVDDKPVWSISCFFIRRGYRRKGVSKALIKGALDFAKQHGAKIVEAYPYTVSEKKTATSIYTGVTSSFETAGFKPVIARKPHRPIMRKQVAR